MIEVYARLVIKGAKEIEDVPEKIRNAVAAKVSELQR